MKEVMGKKSEPIGQGMNALIAYIRECKRLGGTPVIRTKMAGVELKDRVIVSCLKAGDKLPGGTITGVSVTDADIERILSEQGITRKRKVKGGVALGSGAAAVLSFVEECRRRQGIPTVKTRHKGVEFTDKVVVSCRKRPGSGIDPGLKGGTIRVSPAEIAQLKAQLGIGEKKKKKTGYTGGDATLRDLIVQCTNAYGTPTVSLRNNEVYFYCRGASDKVKGGKVEGVSSRIISIIQSEKRDKTARVAEALGLKLRRRRIMRVEPTPAATERAPARAAAPAAPSPTAGRAPVPVSEEEEILTI